MYFSRLPMYHPENYLHQNQNCQCSQQLFLMAVAILDLKLFRSSVKRRHSTGKEFQSLPVEGKKTVEYTSLQHLGLMTEKSFYLLEYKQTFQETEEKKPVQPVQINIYQSNGNDLTWLPFDYEPKLQERQQVKDQQSLIFNICFCNLSKISVITTLVLGMDNMALKSSFRV